MARRILSITWGRARIFSVSGRGDPSESEVNQEHTVYLVEVEDEGELDEWLARHHEELFELSLKGWYTDAALWPRNRSLKMLREWCSFELHTIVVDVGESPLEDNKLEE